MQNNVNNVQSISNNGTQNSPPRLKSGGMKISTKNRSQNSLTRLKSPDLNGKNSRHFSTSLNFAVNGKRKASDSDIEFEEEVKLDKGKKRATQEEIDKDLEVNYDTDKLAKAEQADAGEISYADYLSASDNSSDLEKEASVIVRSSQENAALRARLDKSTVIGNDAMQVNNVMGRNSVASEEEKAQLIGKMAYKYNLELKGNDTQDKLYQIFDTLAIAGSDPDSIVMRGDQSNANTGSNIEGSAANTATNNLPSAASTNNPASASMGSSRRGGSGSGSNAGPGGFGGMGPSGSASASGSASGTGTGGQAAGSSSRMASFGDFFSYVFTKLMAFLKFIAEQMDHFI